MPTRIHKAVITNRSVLARKYGASLNKIDQAVAQLITADRDRGLNSAAVDLSDPAAMRKFRGRAVTSERDAKQHKAAIDKIYRSLTPDYLLLLGSIDVIPYQDLKNPLFDGDDPHGDPDRYAYSDLPYACDNPYGHEIEDFIGPTRVVGRLPDITGGRDASYLANLLRVAADYQSRPKSDYDTYLGISARVWRTSTGLSLSSVFGSRSGLQLSPPKGPRWPDAMVGARSHFINCHGAPVDPHFYGQQDDDFPIAHDASYIRHRITAGTICAAECCYGTELYDPAASRVDAMGICNAYLESKAYGFFGSSTIAYGPEDRNAQADIITQDFMRHVLSGASLGRAALQARQDFVMKSAVLDPFELKTLAQFTLLGDPSVHPVQSTPPDQSILLTKSLRKLASDSIGRIAELSLRRETLRNNGLALAQAASVIVTASRHRAAPSIHTALRELLAEVKGIRAATFSVRPGAIRHAKNLAAERAHAELSPTRIHVAVSVNQRTTAPAPQFVAAVAREHAGTLTLRKLASR